MQEQDFTKEAEEDEEEEPPFEGYAARLARMEIEASADPDANISLLRSYLENANVSLHTCDACGWVDEADEFTVDECADCASNIYQCADCTRWFLLPHLDQFCCRRCMKERATLLDLATPANEPTPPSSDEDADASKKRRASDELAREQTKKVCTDSMVDYSGLCV